MEKRKVMANNKTTTFSANENEDDLHLADNKELELTYIAYNKPKGIVCTTEKITDNIIDAIGHPQKILPVGRLDKDSEGLILLTNHNQIIDKITNPKYEHEKEYVVTLNFPVRRQFLKEIAEGMVIQGEKTKPCIAILEPTTKRVFRIILTQGLNRQIRRMCNACDYQVIKLQRVRVMNIQLNKLKIGEWRNLTPDELTTLFAALS